MSDGEREGGLEPGAVSMNERQARAVEISMATESVKLLREIVDIGLAQFGLLSAIARAQNVPEEVVSELIDMIVKGDDRIEGEVEKLMRDNP